MKAENRSGVADLTKILLCCAGLALLGLPGIAQNDPPAAPARDRDRGRAKVDPPVALHVDSNLVQIPVTVLDRDEQSIPGLDKSTFRLFDDKAEQAITHFAVETAPVSIGFVFDSSASMNNKMQRSREAVSTFLKTAVRDDEFFLVDFNDHVNMRTDFTKDAGDVEQQLGFIQAMGRTALLDAIDLSIHHMRQAANPRRALIIVSDGGDNRSRRTAGEIKSLVKEADVQIYAIGIFDPIEVRMLTPEDAAGPALLKSLTKQSGGHLYEVDNLNQLAGVASKIGAALRTQYVLGYYPTQSKHDGKYHKVEVKLVQPKGGPKLQASWRRGYYAPGN
ncbi:MAG TPA: VWA domain-containing protein [Bryobacteraceae bacterium]|nr:VWA domain-containing protein [Bryobacteraceae bacterium]